MYAVGQYVTLYVTPSNFVSPESNQYIFDFGLDNLRRLLSLSVHNDEFLAHKPQSKHFYQVYLSFHLATSHPPGHRLALVAG